MNRYPYTNGHLMIAPSKHTGSLSEVTTACRAELMELAVASQRILDGIYRPGGYNIGMKKAASPRSIERGPVEARLTALRLRAWGWISALK